MTYTYVQGVVNEDGTWGDDCSGDLEFGDRDASITSTWMAATAVDSVTCLSVLCVTSSGFMHFVNCILLDQWF